MHSSFNPHYPCFLNFHTDLYAAYDIITLQTTQLSSLPDQIAHLESHIATLGAARAPPSADPELGLSLPETAALLARREDEVADMDRRLEDLRRGVKEKKEKVEGLREELEPLEERKRRVIGEAREAQRKRGTGGVAAELEERGRWLKGVEGGLRVMLDV